MASHPDGAVKLLPITANHLLLSAAMPDAGNTFKWDFQAKEATGENWDGGIPDFVANLQPDASDLRVGAIGDDWTLANAWGLHRLVQTPGSRELVISGAATSAYPLSSVVDTEIGMWRGCTDALGVQDKPATVPTADGYQGYWPLEAQNSGAAAGAAIYTDWTANGYTGQDHVSSTGKAGQVGNGQQFDGADDYITTAVIDHNLWTASMWVRTSSATLQGLFGRSDGLSADDVMARYHGNAATPNIYIWHRDDTNKRVRGYANVTLSDGAWHHLGIGRRATNTLFVIVDGSPLAVTYDEQTSPGATAFVRPLPIGMNVYDAGNYVNPWNGNLDEFCLASVARSVNWLSACNNMGNNGVFWTVGAEQACGAAGPYLFVPSWWGRVGPSLAGRR